VLQFLNRAGKLKINSKLSFQNIKFLKLPLCKISISKIEENLSGNHFADQSNIQEHVTIYTTLNYASVVSNKNTEFALKEKLLNCEENR
jgi:hypothetical protein